jgi:hypothetical protein
MNMKKNVIALLLFIILTGIMTYPVALRMSNHIPSEIDDPLLVGDPLLNTWILGWNIHKIRTGLSGYWNANLFYPHNLTLTFSEHLAGIAILGLPVMLLTDNIIFTYNFLFLLSFILSGFGAYLLVKHLTGNFWAGIIAGVIFAFSSYKFSQWIHLHMLNAQWIPFGFLYLHKFFEKTKYKYLALFIFFYILQCISSLHNGLFMTVFAVIFIVYYVLVKKIRDKKFLAVTALSLIFAFIVLLPFSYPYIQAKRHYGLKRELSDAKNYSAQVKSYLTAYRTNRIYGKLTRRLWQHGGKGGFEKELFFGIIASLLAFICLWPSRPIRPKKMKITHNEKFYLLMVISSVLFSFGPAIQFFGKSSLPGPYLLLYYLVPGFKGIRVPARFAIMVLLGIGVLAGYGYRKFSEKFDVPIKKSILGMTLVMLILAECLIVPLPAPQVKTGENIPSVYKWLSQQRDDFAIVELPLHSASSFDVRKESLYLYYSAYHWKKILNGSSGYYSPTYFFLSTQMLKFPSRIFLNLLKKLGISYMIVHSTEYEKSHWQEIYGKLNGYKNEISFVGKFDSDFVYQINNSSFGLTRPEEPNPELLIPRKSWFAESNFNNERAPHAIDGNTETLWYTGPKQPGQYFQLDLGKIYEFNRIWLDFGAHLYAYPENYKLEVSGDRRNWRVVISEGNDLPELLISSIFYSPSNSRIGMKFNTQKARYIRITQYGKDKSYGWGVSEIEVQ